MKGQHRKMLESIQSKELETDTLPSLKTNKKVNLAIVLLFFLFSSLIFISRIWYIRQTNVLAIRNDEYGYWSHAAFFTGHDWSDVLSGHMNWYSYGYSLVLVPLFWISHNLYFMYKAAIVLNGIFSILSFILCFACARILFPKIGQTALLTVSFIVCMYSSYITQGAIAWSETFLYLCVWLLLYLFLKFEQHPSVSRALLLSLCMGACYITHNRTIGIVTAYCITVLFLRLTDAIGWKQFFALTVPLVVILFVNIDLKTYLCIMEGFGLKPKNGMGAQKEHLLSLLTFQGWQNLICSLGGQLWSLMTSTFGLLFWGLLRCCSYVFHAFREKRAMRHTIFYLFTLLSAIGTFLISAISLIDPASITNLSSNADLSYFIYTRYDECIIGILLLLGFTELMHCAKDRRFLLLNVLCCCLYAVLSLILYFNLQKITGTWHYRSFCAAGIGFYRIFSKKFAMHWCMLIGAAGYFLLVMLLSFANGRLKKLRLTVSGLLTVIIFVPTGLYSAQIGTINSQLGKVSSGNLDMYEQLKKVVGNRDVYCTLDDTSNYRIAYELQVNLIDTHVYSITMDDLPVKENGYFICCSNGSLDDLVGTGYYLLKQSRDYAVVVKGKALAKDLLEKYSSLELQEL